MKDFSLSHTNTNGSSFPDTAAINATGPSATDGTEFIKDGIDEFWGFAQALLTQDGAVPNGISEIVTNSQLLDALVNQFGIPSKYLAGFILANAADADHDITLSVGQARSDLAASLARIALTTPITKQIDANWVAGNDVGGFPSGLVLGANTWYHKLAIKNPTTGVVDAGFDTSLVAANLLADAAGYTEFKRVGSVLTDGSSNILPFSMHEYLSGMREVLWAAIMEDFDSTIPAAPTLLPLAVPLGVKVEAMFRAQTPGSETAVALFTSPDQSAVAPSATFNTVPAFQLTGGNLGVELCIRTDVSSQIRGEADGTFSLALYTRGWRE